MSASKTIDDSSAGSRKTQTIMIDLLDLFFNPLLALLILFLECEIFDLGTASTMGGSSSNKDARPGIERYHAGVLSV